MKEISGDRQLLLDAVRATAPASLFSSTTRIGGFVAAPACAAVDTAVSSFYSWPLVALNLVIGFAIGVGCMTFASILSLVDYATRPSARAFTLSYNGARAVILLSRPTRRRDTDVHLHGFVAWPYRRGAGRRLAEQVMTYLDDTQQTASLSCWPKLAPFYAQGGFEIVRRRWWGTLQMRRPSGHVDDDRPVGLGA